MEAARKRINKSIIDNKSARKIFDWLLKELSEINKQKYEKDEKTAVIKEAQNPLGEIAKMFHQYCKAIHTLDQIRWQS